MFLYNKKMDSWDEKVEKQERVVRRLPKPSKQKMATARIQEDE